MAPGMKGVYPGLKKAEEVSVAAVNRVTEKEPLRASAEGSDKVPNQAAM